MLRHLAAPGRPPRAPAPRRGRAGRPHPGAVPVADRAAWRRGARGSLRQALAAPRVVFTSPAAVAAAASLQPLRPRATQAWVAVGAGTAQALRRAGAGDIRSPRRMDSEGLLALPQLREVQGLDVGLVTAPGGRGVIAS